mgnify:CR=1 FL=1
MTINIQDSHTLAGVVEKLQPINSFWLNLVFPTVQTFEDEFIDFDIVDKGRRVAPFVAPNVAGKPMTSKGFATRRFKPAYVKPKHAVEPNRVLKRRAGEAYTGSMSPEQRERAIITDILREQREMIERRWDIMAASAVIDGSVTIAGDDYPEVTISFGRAAGNTVTLGNGERWGDSGIKPLDQIQTWADTVYANSGYAPTDIIMGAAAWAAFRVDPDVQKQLEMRRGSVQSELNLAPEVLAPVAYKGQVGAFRVWVYKDWYENNSGTNVEIMNSKAVVLLNPQAIEGVRAFGAIMDARAGFQAMPIFSKMWLNEDPSVTYLMSQSAPLMIPTRPNAVLKATVLA